MENGWFLAWLRERYDQRGRRNQRRRERLRPTSPATWGWWATDYCGATVLARPAHHDERGGLLDNRGRGDRADRRRDMLHAAGVGDLQAVNITDVMHDPQIQARRRVVKVDHAEVAPARVIRLSPCRGRSSPLTAAVRW